MLAFILRPPFGFPFGFQSPCFTQAEVTREIRSAGDLCSEDVLGDRSLRGEETADSADGSGRSSSPGRPYG
jgi:hypothetical protein